MLAVAQQIAKSAKRQRPRNRDEMHNLRDKRAEFDFARQARNGRPNAATALQFCNEGTLTRLGLGRSA
jgi:hypothetical protein